MATITPSWILNLELYMDFVSDYHIPQQKIPTNGVLDVSKNSCVQQLSSKILTVMMETWVKSAVASQSQSSTIEELTGADQPMYLSHRPMANMGQRLKFSNRPMQKSWKLSTRLWQRQMLSNKKQNIC